MGHVNKASNDDNFFLSLIFSNTNLKAGKYTLIVDVIWALCPDLKEFKDVFVRLFTDEEAPLTKIDKQQGYPVLFNALKLQAASDTKSH